MAWAVRQRIALPVCVSAMCPHCQLLACQLAPACVALQQSGVSIVSLSATALNGGCSYTFLPASATNRGWLPCISMGSKLWTSSSAGVTSNLRLRHTPMGLNAQLRLSMVVARATAARCCEVCFGSCESAETTKQASMAKETSPAVELFTGTRDATFIANVGDAGSPECSRIFRPRGVGGLV